MESIKRNFIQVISLFHFNTQKDSIKLDIYLVLFWTALILTMSAWAGIGDWHDPAQSAGDPCVDPGRAWTAEAAEDNINHTNQVGSILKERSCEIFIKHILGTHFFQLN